MTQYWSMIMSPCFHTCTLLLRRIHCLSISSVVEIIIPRLIFNFDFDLLNAKIEDGRKRISMRQWILDFRNPQSAILFDQLPRACQHSVHRIGRITSNMDTLPASHFPSVQPNCYLDLQDPNWSVCNCGTRDVALSHRASEHPAVPVGMEYQSKSH